MNLFQRIALWLINRITLNRVPDYIVGGANDPYLLRWFVIPRNPIFNIYLHRFLRDDDDRALHDHPWFWCSLLLLGSYVEHTIARGGIHRRTLRSAGSVKVSGPWRAHRIELIPWRPFGLERFLPEPQTWTLFITGPRIRQWGFHCPERGWVHWKEFTAPEDKGLIGRGCGETV